MSDGELEVSAPAAPPSLPGRSRLRGRLLAVLAAAVVSGGAAYWAWDELIGSRSVTTDNAYVTADVAQVSAQVAGPVRDVPVTDTQAVHRGDVLAVLDDAEQRIALASADAEYDRSLRRVHGYFATNDAQAAQVAQRDADFRRAEAALRAAEAGHGRAKIDLSRRRGLAASGAVSGDELTRVQSAFDAAEADIASARAAVDQARAARRAAEAALAAGRVLTDGTVPGTNPEVQAARARVDQARLDLDRTVVLAPVDGVIARRTVQPGQRVMPGTPLMEVVPLAAVHVDANFKESQLRNVRPGQRAILESDLYGSGVSYHGTVSGLAGGTGAAFAVIPAQNATGNWIKVVQRLPVRISLDPEELARHPLRVGQSMTVTVDIRDGIREAR